MSRPLQHLLLVEDELAWRERLDVVARAEGVKVSHAADGQEALEWLCTRPRASHPDLILLDLLMPRMDGWELYGQLRTNARLRHLGVLMFSGALSGQEPPLDGVVGYLRKPHTPEAVDGALRAQLRGLPALPERAATEPYALHLPEDVCLPLRTLPGPLGHAVRLHLLRAAELVGTELPLASTWLMALPGTPPSLLVTVDGVQVELEVDDTQRRLIVHDVTLSPHLRHGT
ncbi:response regulator [Corallococcus macrosporus]|uniref:Response regulator receiver domain-containing protein n=1 Tax=Myxococcus fulvus (strain ATCC BAA-855 / HW-1) TaxID=483219 RepID=F8CQ62_MYXFH|nr:response regulator [Corallococcus macrosporus]AEI64185.1 response regulator receiver domain-containing protein [Corallococcus macrosporus]